MEPKTGNNSIAGTVYFTPGMNYLSPHYSLLGGLTPQHFESAMSSQEMPYYYNALGEKQVNYAYVSGPHYGSVCECEECVKFNAEMQSREEQRLLVHQIHDEASAIMRDYYVSPSFSPQVNPSIFIQIMREFTCKHIAEYQKTMMQKVHQMQVRHTSQMRAMRSKLAEKRIDLPVHHSQSGRMFREGEKST